VNPESLILSLELVNSSDIQIHLSNAVDQFLEDMIMEKINRAPFSDRLKNR